MAFSFGFGGDDFDHDVAEEAAQTSATTGLVVDSPPNDEPQSLTVKSLLDQLPSKLSWNVAVIKSARGRVLLLPRRELFDVRMQLMAEDEGLATSKNIPGLDDADIRTSVYEGGFKSWECSFDLASHLLDRGPRKDLDDLCRVDHVVEMGCGTALPSSVLYHYAVTEALPLYFTFTDFNVDVLRLVTFPNLFLTWASTLAGTGEKAGVSELMTLSETATGDLDVTPELKDMFLQQMEANLLNLTFITGSWSPVEPWLKLVPSSSQMNTLVLGSETIYSSTALRSFTAAVIAILTDVRLGKAMVAAKRFYFGVGGSVDTFKIECAEYKAVCAEVDNHGLDLGQEQGVRRCLLEVQMI